MKRTNTYDKLISNFRDNFNQIEDFRASNASHKLSDILMSGFAMFNLKYPSLLKFEQQTDIEKGNLKDLFGIEKLCSDAQFRKVLDDVDPENLKSIFPKRFQTLKNAGTLKQYKFLNKYLLLSIDGVHFFESKKVKCEQCIVKNHRDGTKSYNHSMLSVALVHPDKKEVFTLGGEAIEKQDGESKNDCELNASKRLQKQLSQQYQGFEFIIVEDALYANEPHIQQILSNNWQYIINVKPSSHKALFNLFNTRKEKNQLKSHTIKEEKTTHQFYWMNKVLLNGQGNVHVNFLCYQYQSAKGKTKQFTWVTSLPISKKNVQKIMKAGRARWKIENECFNTLKNQGYNFEHNYGHGKNQLCNNMAYLMLMAFLTDQMVQLFCKTFNKIWEKARAKTTVWERIRAIYLTSRINSYNQIFQKLEKIFIIQLE